MMMFLHRGRANRSSSRTLFSLGETSYVKLPKQETLLIINLIGREREMLSDEFDQRLLEDREKVDLLIVIGTSLRVRCGFRTVLAR